MIKEIPKNEENKENVRYGPNGEIYVVNNNGSVTPPPSDANREIDSVPSFDSIRLFVDGCQNGVEIFVTGRDKDEESSFDVQDIAFISDTLDDVTRYDQWIPLRTSQGNIISTMTKKVPPTVMLGVIGQILKTGRKGEGIKIDFSTSPSELEDTILQEFARVTEKGSFEEKLVKFALGNWSEDVFGIAENARSRQSLKNEGINQMDSDLGDSDDINNNRKM